MQRFAPSIKLKKIEIRIKLIYKKSNRRKTSFPGYFDCLAPVGKIVR